jgi:hypothetical protein
VIVTASPSVRGHTKRPRSTIGLDAQTCAFERPGGPSFEMLAADVVIYEKTGVLHVIGPLAGNDNSAAAG